MTKLTRFCSVVVVLLGLCSPTFGGFNHRVIPACDESEDVCKFEFDIRYKFSMVYYFNGYSTPIVIRNGTMMKRSVYNSEEFTPVTSRELSEILTVDGVYKLLFAINGELPGPPIVVYEGQTIEVSVKNGLSNEAFTIHWHGMIQKNTPWMDGASMVTQCPINPGDTFLYRYKAEPRGTHWYHSHQGTMRTDGVAGPIIVLPRNKRTDIPEVEEEFILMIQDWNRNSSSLESHVIQHFNMHLYSNNFNCTTDCYKPTHSVDGTNMGVVPFHSGLINGKGHYYPDKGEDPLIPELPIETFNVKPDKYYRFRIINAAMLFSFRFSIDEHTIHVVATDGNDVEAESAQSIIMSSGERFDILVKTDGNPRKNYFIRAETIEVKNRHNEPNRPGRVTAILRYEDAPEELPKTERETCTRQNVCKVLNCPYKLYPSEAHIRCLSTAHFRSTQEMIKRQPVPLPPRGEDIREDFLNFHYAGFKGSPFMAAINGYKFEFPTCPPQITYDVPARTCFNDCQDHDCGEYCECTHTLKYDQMPLNAGVQMVLVNNDEFAGATNHPIHIHGHHVHILKIAYPEVDEETGIIVKATPDIRCAGKDCKYPSWAKEEWAGGNIPDLNLRNPPLKDTVVVPRMGYVVLRFPLDNPGYWYMHCHMEAHQLEGMTLIIKEGLHSAQKKPPKNFPTCGDFTWSYEEYEEIVNGPMVAGLGAVQQDDEYDNKQQQTATKNKNSGASLSQTSETVLIIALCGTLLCIVIGVVKVVRSRSKHYVLCQKSNSSGTKSIASRLCGTDRQPLLTSKISESST